MLKQIYTLVFALLLSLTFSGILVAQSLAGSDKDLYQGPVPKEKIQDGQNISTSYSSDLVLLYDNGPLVTNPGGGAGGADASALQTALTLTIYGYGAQITANNSVADDFTISGSDWAIDEIQFFTYQTGSTTTSTINDVRMQIWNGPPNAGGSVIYGDLTTNRLSSTSWTNMYRVLDTDLLNTQRPVMRVVVQFAPALVLTAGTYWLQWQYGGSLASGPWAPPVSVVGQTTTGNGLQNLAGTWSALLDGTFPQGVPFLIFGNSGPPCPVGAPTNPNPPDGATNVPISGNTATWTNSAGTTQVELWFGEVGNLAQVYSGPSISSFALPALQYLTDYGWYVVCKNDTCGTTGPTWTFTTIQDPNLATLFCDDFEAGIGNWTITNEGGTAGCIWMTRVAPFPNTYTLPPTSTGAILTADVDECGSGSTMLSTATITNSVDASIYQTVWIEFDNDWNILDAQDEAHVEISVDGGTTWIGVWDQIGVDIRSTHEIIDISTQAALTTFLLRLRSVQPGWDWWWVVDNVCVYGSDPIPVELTSFVAVADYGMVELSWITATETNNQGFEVQRSFNGNEYETIAFIDGHGTTTEPHAYSYSDRNINSGSYTYRLKQVDFDGSFEYSNVIEVEVPVLREFSLDQNYPNPFNPSTKIAFRLAVDSKVSLKVFDILGQEVITLVNSNLVAGAHNVNFDASSLNSGVYLYRIEATGIDGTNFVDVKKMILTK